jgi:GT2 family glycosyltransferase
MSRNSAKVIIIPAYNAGGTIAETLRSVQACRRIEEIDHLLGGDDASTDDTVSAVRAAWSGRPALTVVSNEKNIGERHTVNAAIERVKDTYEWVLLLHADDVVKPNWIELYLPRMSDADSRVASICSSYDCWYQDVGRIEAGQDDFNREIEVINGSFESVLDTLKTGCWWHISGCAIRVSSFLQIGGFQPNMPQLGDFEWLLRCLKKGNDIVYIPRTTLLYRMHSGSVSSNSFCNGQDLAEQLNIYGQYLHEGYLEAREYRRIRLQVVHAAVKRIIKQATFGNFAPIPKLFQVCRQAARAQRAEIV